MDSVTVNILLINGLMKSMILNSNGKVTKGFENILYYLKDS